jgi:hypothetical protein
MIQQLRQQSFHPTNLWGKQKRQPLACNPFENMFHFEHINLRTNLTKGMVMNLHNGMFIHDFRWG